MHKIIKGLGLLSLLGSTAYADAPPPDQVTIDVITVNGSGCPAGTAAVAVSLDNTAFTVTYSGYTAKVGVGAGPTEFRKNCNLNLIVHFPQGFSYAVTSANHRGFASLAAGATATQSANYFFQGQSTTGLIQHALPAGPFEDDWQNTDTTEITDVVYSPCGEQRNLNINTELRVFAGTSDPTKTTSFVSMDSTDGAFTTTYRFSWLACPATP